VNEKKQITLKLVNGYTARYSKLHLHKQMTPVEQPAISFGIATMEPSQAKTELPKTSECRNKLDLPILTAILWNTRSKAIENPVMRRALTQAVPRGEIMRTLGGGLGKLVSGPILREHPGYASAVQLIPYNLESANESMKHIGYTQAQIGAARIQPNGSQMQLKVGIKNEGRHEILEKMIADSFAAIGINLEFVPSQGNAQEQLDGILTAVNLPWPSSDLRGFLGARSSPEEQIFSFGLLDDKGLRDLIEAHHLALSNGVMAEDLLNKIHVRWAELEPWTPILSHQACVTFKGSELRGRPNSFDPDWFRKYIVQ
jgi:ABC-type transport system substrate-binding protein